MIIKERLEEALGQVRSQIAQDVRREQQFVDFGNGELVEIVTSR